MTGYWLLLPEALVLVAAIAALFGEFLPGRDRGVAYLGAAAAAVAAVLVASAPLARTLFDGLLAFDSIARYGRASIPALTAIWLLWIAGRGTGEDVDHSSNRIGAVHGREPSTGDFRVVDAGKRKQTEIHQPCLMAVQPESVEEDQNLL